MTGPDLPTPQAGPPRLKPCGTVAAHERHKRDGEPPCDACKAARTAADKQRHAANRAGAGSRSFRVDLGRRARKAGPPADAAWRGRAACDGRHAVMEGPAADALTVCGTCGVRWPCLRWVMSLSRAADLDDAVIGGLAFAERKSARRAFQGAA